ncbi:MAG: hypothetical protein JXA18_12995 [Chitinispirillaceae bacterium]|nr:hypothetical protein [Chitinispirillaceae bacterium]
MPERLRYLNALFLLLVIPLTGAWAHVEEGEGETLQLYSYRTSSPPRINACLTDATNSGGTDAVQGTDNDEWKDAYIRQIKIVSMDNVDTLNGTLFFMNDDSALYIGITTDFNNSSNNTYIEFAFDQGVGGGNHNDLLEGGGTGINNGEYAARVYPNKGYAQQKLESSFDGSSWVQQNNGTEKFIGYGRNFGTSFVQAEFKIPLLGNPSTDDTHSYLNITGTSELGVFVSFYAQGGSVYFRWPETNGAINDATTAPGWMDLKLGVERSYVTFYSTVNANGNPVIDGNISGGAQPDDAWRGSYRRNLTLTDFAGSTLNAVLYSVEDNTGNNVYVGLKVFDDDNDAGDYCQIYQEEDPSVSPATTRNYLLDNGTENSLVADVNAFTLADDRYWNGITEVWASDATNTTQKGLGAWYASGSFYEYEFLIDRDAGNDGDDQDIYMADGSLMGFHIKYHDDAGTGADYYWELSPNSEAIEIDPNQNAFVTTGWPDLQTGAPYVQVVYPEDGSNVEGVVNVRIYAEDENANGIDSASFYRTTMPGTKYQLTRIAGTNEWSGTWDVSSLTNGADTLVFEVGDDDGIVMERLVNLAIANGTGASTPPTVTITSPAAGSMVSGTVTIAFSASATGATIETREISIDGSAYGATTTTMSHTWNTGTLAEGSHTVQLKITDSNGRSTTSNAVIYIVKNSPSVSLTAPAADSVVSGTLVVTFTATAVAPATIDSTAISIDGGAYRATSTATTDTLDTKDLAEGAHTIQIRVVDSNGKTVLSELRKFNIRNSPTVTLTAPAADSVVSGTLVVSFIATPVAPATIDSTAISIDGGAYRATSTATTDTLDTQDLTEGAHTVQIRVTDSNGKIGLSELRKFVVGNNPSVTLLSPGADTVISGTATIRFRALAIAPATITRREVFIDGALLDTSDTDSTFGWNSVDYNDGQHTVQVRIIDSNGKRAVSNIVSVTLFNTPVVTITAPGDSSAVYGIDTVRFTVTYAPGTARDTSGIAFNGGAWVATTGSSSHAWITTDFRDGTHTVQVRVKADNGKTGYSQIKTFEVSNAPTANITAPAPGEALAGVYTVRFRIDPVAPATVSARQVSIDGGPWSDSLVGDSTFTMSTAGWKSGTHSIQVRGVDSRGRIGYSHALSFIVDNEAPLAADPKTVYGESAVSAKSGTEVLVTMLVKDNLVGLKADSAVVLTSASIDDDGAVTYLMRDDGEAGDKVKGDNVYSALVEVATDSTGSIGYSITAVDLLGNDTTLSSAIKLDNTAPSTDFSLEPEPEDGDDVRSGTTYFRRLVMKGSYGDVGGSGLARVFIAVRNDSNLHVNTSPVVLAPEDSLFSRILELIPGANTIVLVAIDKAGNRDSTLGQVVYLEPKATKIVDRKGATINNPDGASVVVPEDALLSKVEVTIVPVEPVEERKPLNKTLTLLNVAHDFGPSGTTFRKAITLTLPYTEADLDRDQDGTRDIDPEKLVVVFWDGGTWRAAGSGRVDTDARTVTVEVNHFTVFDLAVSTAVSPDELLAFWSANPVRYGTGAYFTYNVPKNGSVSLRIVDMAGDLVYQLIPENTPAAEGSISPPKMWRGQNTAGRFAGAGLYVWVFSFKPRSGGDPTIIRKPIGLLYSEEGR